MRRQHQMVAFAAPGYMIAKSAPVGGLALFPLDGYIFVKSGHALPPGKAFYSRRRSNPKKTSAMQFYFSLSAILAILALLAILKMGQLRYL
jgi:hypothetical protein